MQQAVYLSISACLCIIQKNWTEKPKRWETCTPP